MATNVISARPIISADAVDAVRLGLRIGVLAGERAGGAAEPRAGPAEHGSERTDRTLRIQRDADEEDQRSRSRVPAAGSRSSDRCRRSRRPRAGSPSASVTIEKIGPNRDMRETGRVAPSRTAAIGGTRVALIAGRRLASSVTMTPTSRLTMIVRVAKTVPPSGKLDADRGEQSVQALRDSEPEEEADDGSEQSDRRAPRA